MPYPPPHGPPGDSTFQGIGLLPEQGLPDQTGEAGNFLETDGTIASWEPVGGGALPPQTGHAGEFLTTDGSSASWDAIPGTVYDITNFDGGNAHPNDETYDVSLAYYEALAAATQATSYPLSGVVGKIYFPPGQWYTSMPLMVPGQIEVTGGGWELTTINAGIGTSATPSLVQGFSGPVLYNTALIADPAAVAAFVPQYGVSLHTTGQSLILTDPTVTGSWPLLLHDSYPWSSFLGNLLDSTKLCLRFEYKATLSAIGLNMNCPIIASRGPDVWTDPIADQAIGVYLTSNAGGTQLFFKAVLSTQPGWAPGTFSMQAHGTYEEIISSAVSNNTRYDLEIDYDGAHFDFYVNGVSQGHVAMTGPICKAPWEGMNIGAYAGPETTVFDPTSYKACSGLLGSVELANTNRHSGTGSFSPAPGPYVADSNTLWMSNWDQGQLPLAPAGGMYLPFVLAQTVITTAGRSFFGPNAPALSTGLTLLPHYIRLISAATQEAIVSNLTINCGGNTSGLITYACSRALFDNVNVVTGAHFGIKISDESAYYALQRDCAAWACSDIGLQLQGDAQNSQSQGCGIGAVLFAGIRLHSHLCQPAYNTYAGMVLMGGAFTSTFNITNCSNDAEVWSFLRSIAPLVIADVAGASIYSSENFLDAISSNTAPILITGSPPRYFTSIGDVYRPGIAGGGVNPLAGAYNGSPAKFIEIGASTLPRIAAPLGTIINPGGNTFTSQFDGVPTITADNVITIQRPEGATNTQGISTTDTPAHNLAGIFTIEAGYTAGGPEFDVAEEDDNYIINIQVIGYSGSAPAAGSTDITGYTTAVGGFTATCGADPAGTCVITFGYQIVRTPYKPLYFDFLPTVPSSIPNPLLPVIPTSTPFAIGVTLVPASGNCFTWYTATAYETAFSQGTSSGTADWFELNKLGNTFTIQGLEAGSTIAIPEPKVVNGRLVTPLNPGPHNFVLTNRNGNLKLYVDGQLANLFPPNLPWGGQSTNIYLGERPDASQPLTVATLKNLKIDRDYKVCITREAGSQPGSKDQCLAIGDDWSVGTTTANAAGSYVSQLSDARFASQFWWFGCASFLNKWLTNQRNPSFLTQFPGLVDSIWIPWGQDQTALLNLVVMAGWNDILGVGSSPVDGVGIAATDIWAEMLSVLEGTAATGTFTPPVAPSPPDSFPNTLGFAEYVVPSSGTATCVIGGHSVNAVFSVDAHTTVTNLVATLNGTPAIAALVTAYAYNGPQSSFTWIVQIFAVAQGTAGNGITVSTDGVGGASWYTGFPSTGTTFGGQDVTLTINDVEFVANFDTDADTTVNDLITLINADPTTSALVTPTLVSHKLLLTAVAVGKAGNSIRLSTNGLNGAAVNDTLTAPIPLHLTGGVSGAIGNGVTNIIVCNVPPMGTQFLYTAGKETERLALNVLIANWVTAHAVDGAVLADVDVTLRDAGAHQNLDPAYDDGTGYPNAAAQTALYTLIDGLAP